MPVLRNRLCRWGRVVYYGFYCPGTIAPRNMSVTMSHADHVHAVERNVVTEFLRQTLPFNELDAAELEELARATVIGFYPEGMVILEQGVSDVDKLYVIQKGGVRVFFSDPSGVQTLVDFRGEGGHFGALGVIRGAKAHLNVQTVEDTFCFLISGEAFLRLIHDNPQFARHYLLSLSENLVDSAYSELRCRKLEARGQAAFYLFSSSVGDIIHRRAEVISASATIHSAAARMSELDIGSLLVTDAAGGIVGIVTDKNLRNKVVAQRLDYDQAVETIMATPVRTIPAHALVFDAVLQMMDQQVHHLGVTRDGSISGVVTAHDMMVFQGSSPVYLLREIDAQKQIEGLHALSAKIPNVVRSLIEEGAKANHITRVISVLNDHIINRLVTLMVERLGPPPVRFCWLLMGSEGRKEQTFRTDQDNAILYEDPGEEWENVKAAKLYFREFGNKSSEHLASCGYPPCKDGFTASRAHWRKPYAVWSEYFDEWMTVSNRDELAREKIFFDFRFVSGDQDLAERLRHRITEHAQHSKYLQKFLINDCLATKPPLSFFRNFIVEKNGEHKNHLDLKLRGLTPFVDFARMMALRNGIEETNTAGRLLNCKEKGLLPGDLYAEIMEAYHFMMQLRLIHQLRSIETGRELHHYVDPAELSELERRTLKDAFGVISRVQEFATKARDSG